MKKKISIFSLVTFLPAGAFAACAGGTSIKDFETLFTYAKCLLTDIVVPFLFAIAIVVFLVGVVRYVAAGDNEEKRAAGRQIMFFGIIALFVMVGVWGFVKILATSFGIDYALPKLPSNTTS